MRLGALEQGQGGRPSTPSTIVSLVTRPNPSPGLAQPSIPLILGVPKTEFTRVRGGVETKAAIGVIRVGAGPRPIGAGIATSSNSRIAVAAWSCA